MKAGFGLKGTWRVVHRDVNGNILSEEVMQNLVTNEGYDHILNTVCHGGTQITTWYLAPFKNDYTPLVTDTYASPGYTEATNTDYDSPATRPEWTEGAASGQSITNGTAITITAAGAVTIYGFGLVGGGSAPTTKGDAAGGGILLSSGRFSAAKTLADNETLDLTYTLAKA